MFRNSTLKRSTPGHGFSLIEVIVVVSIVAIITLLSVPAIEQMLKGSRLSIAGTSIIDELNIAQQTALSRSRPVEVRFYKVPSAENPNGPPAEYRAIQTFLSTPANQDIPLGKVVTLPSGVIITSDDITKSSIFATAAGAAPLIDPTPQISAVLIPGYDTNYEYVSFRFKGNGETDMNQIAAFFTLISKLDPVTPSGLPTNFVTIQIDPLTGRTQTYRP